tara:strand:+ start:169 stop:1470 length:1302 start_codon:yes stop_codon:yes gene_type:complete
MSNPYEQFRQAIMGGLPIDNAVSFDQFQDARLSGLVNSLQPNPQLMNNMSNVSQQINQEQIDKNAKELKRKERRQALEDIAARFGIINAQQSGNYQQANIMQNNLLQRQQAREAEAKLQEALANMSPDQRAIYNEAVALGGPVAGYNALQSIRNAEITALQKQREAETYRNAGFDERSIALFTGTDLSVDEILKLTGPSEDQKQIDALLGAGYTPDEANAIAVGGLDPDDISELKKSPPTSESIINEVNDIVAEQTKQTKVQDDYANLSQAFGPFDSLQENIINVPGRFLAGTDFAPETAAAIRDRNSLNLEILSTLANDYEGRPNVLLLNEIKKNIPENSATSEADAYQKYSNFLDRTKTRIAYLEQGIRSESNSDAIKEKYRVELIKAKSLEIKLDAAVLGLNPDKGSNSLEPTNENFFATGKYNNFYLEE